MNDPTQPIRFLSLDAAGTLIQPDPPVEETYARVLQAHGFAGEPAAIARRFGEGFASVPRRSEVSDAPRFWREVVREAVGPELAGDGFEAVFGDLWDAFGSGDQWKLTSPEWPEALEAFRNAGIQVVVSSNNDTRLRRVLRDIGILPCFDRLFISDEFGIEKPDPRFFRYVRNALGALPERILHCGDREDHDGAARGDGWDFLLWEGETTLHQLRQRLVG